MSKISPGKTFIFSNMKRTADLLKQLSQQNIQWYRKIVQYLFLATVVLIGIKFSIFVDQLASGMSPTITRPPGIEAFLPISSLISLKYWVVTGIFNPVHPSGLIILLMALATGLLLKRGFCSWICPFGLLTEYLNRLHKLIFRKNVKLPEMCGGVPGKRHALHFGLKTKGHPQTLGLFSGSLPAFYRRLVDGQNDRLLANRHLQQ